MSENLNRFREVLSQIFEMDKADLDFGIYRIINQKRNEINSFLDTDLIPLVKNELLKYENKDHKKIQDELEKAIKQAEDLGEDPDTIKKVIELKQKLRDQIDVSSLESEIFSHLTTFFRRYYDKGDFISKRRYKEGVYAIPYEGEEVKLYWANHDQYYIKTSENFKNYIFTLDSGRKVHFKIVEAETEKDNNKAQGNKSRQFILCEDNPYEIQKDELIINFNYTFADKKKQEALNKEAAVKILSFKDVTKWSNELSALLPTEKNKDRTLLEKHLNDYTAKNSFDYFIHKDLGGFLRRELDFFIKNEVMHIDDLDTEHELDVKLYLSKVKVIKRIGYKIIELLEQIENFQKKLWLKKKFVVQCDYCITLDRIPEELYPEIIKNKEQIEEWKRLFAIHEMTGEAPSPVTGESRSEGKEIEEDDDESEETLFDEKPDDEATVEEETEDNEIFVSYSEPLTKEFLKANKYLVLDTKFFDSDFKDRLLSSMDDIDENCDGLLINSENFQALNLIHAKYREQLKCSYIDPPYNTDASSIQYKNNYKDSSWISLMEHRLKLTYNLLKADGIICVAIDDDEVVELRYLLSSIFEKQVGIAPVRSNPAGRKTKGKFAPAHEYALFYGKTDLSIPGSLSKTVSSLARYPKEDELGRFAWANFIRSGNNDKRVDRPKLYYPIFVNINDSIRIPKMEWSEADREYKLLEKPKSNEVIVYPDVYKDNIKIEKNWQRGHVRVSTELQEYRIRRNNNGDVSIDFKTRMDEESLPITWWDNKEYASANYGASELKELFGNKTFDFSKAITLVVDCVKACNYNLNNSYVLDYFAGSGTTGHAVINLNREDSGTRKYILVEMGEYFDTVLKPRIQKVIYSKDWKNGRPVSRKGSSHMFKYMRLESYEDTLNNLILNTEDIQHTLDKLPAKAKEEYTLRYMLDMETRGSNSLLNINKLKDPFNYTLKITRQNAMKDEKIDLVETFNYLLGLKVKRISPTINVEYTFDKNSEGKLVISDKKGKKESFKFKTVEGENRDGESVLVIWRVLNNDIEKDNTALSRFFEDNFKKHRFDKVYINGDSNIPGALLIEEHFKTLMFDVKDV
jgi:adenine-specific DNA-methyltransferase